MPQRFTAGSRFGSAADQTEVTAVNKEIENEGNHCGKPKGKPTPVHRFVIHHAAVSNLALAEKVAQIDSSRSCLSR